MSRFIQLHLLTSYPPSNLNRDDLGRPKTAVMGGEQRLRISSQSLKRAWRQSDIFKTALKNHIGKRTKEMGGKIFERLKKQGVAEDDAKAWAKLMAGYEGPKNKEKGSKFGKLKKEDKSNAEQGLETEQLVHFSPEEIQKINALCDTLAEQKRPPAEEELKSLLLKNEDHKAADIAVFGRMLASSPDHNTEAAVQVAHAVSVHSVVVEDDFWTAVDDLNEGAEDAGAGHLGETEFAAGLFYLYICIDREKLNENLCSDKTLAGKTLSALIECAAAVAPTGKQNSFASRARASYIRCEAGDQQPRSLSVAFLKPVKKGDMLRDSIKALEETAANMDKVYGECYKNSLSMNAVKGEGSLKKIIEFSVQ